MTFIKHIIFIPARFVFFTVLFSVVILCVLWMLNIQVSFDIRVVLPSIMLGILAADLRMIFQKVFPFVCILCSFLIACICFTILRDISVVVFPAVEREHSTAGQTILHDEQYALYIGHEKPPQTMVFADNTTMPRLSVYDNVVIDEEDIVTLPNQISVSTEVFRTEYEIPRWLQRVTHDISRVQAVLQLKPVIYPRFFRHIDGIFMNEASVYLRIYQLLSAAVLSLCISVVWVLVRFSRWSLFNVLLALVYIRFILFIPRLMDIDFIQRFFASWQLPEMLYVFAWLLLTALMLILLIFLPRLKDWQRNMIHEK